MHCRDCLCTICTYGGGGDVSLFVNAMELCMQCALLCPKIIVDFAPLPLLLYRQRRVEYIHYILILL